MPRAVKLTSDTADPGLASVGSLPGVGPALLLALERVGIARVQDLWFHLPLRYEDRTRVTPIAELRVGESAQVEGTISAVERGFRFKPQLRVAIGDAGPATLTLRFFHFRKTQVDLLVPGTRLRCYGEVRHGSHGLEIVHPTYQRVLADSAVEERLTPVYPTTEGLGQKRLASLIGHALERMPDEATLELVPRELCDPLDMLSLREALRIVHRPPADADTAAFALGAHPAQQRLAFEEMLTHHLSLKRLRAQVREHAAPSLRGDGHLRETLLAALLFALPLPAARRRAIARDLAQAKQMFASCMRFGSGKRGLRAAALPRFEAARRSRDGAHECARRAHSHLSGCSRRCSIRSGFRKGAGKAPAPALDVVPAGALSSRHACADSAGHRFSPWHSRSSTTASVPASSASHCPTRGAGDSVPQHSC